jgi:ubiquinone/menaquinone biosynthesis C-methylase UbiE
MNLIDLKYLWNRYGKEDPLYQILSTHGYKKSGWSEKDFFDTGIKEIDLLMQEIKELNRKPHFGKSLDFGCGVGRLTQAMANYSDEVYGIDISDAMIDKARKYNQFEGKCFYEVNDEDSLCMFEDSYFDLIYSSITLQHMKPEYSKKYIKEFIRILKPSGLLIFQLPSKEKNIFEKILYAVSNLKIKKLILYLTPEFIHRVYLAYRFKGREKPVFEMHGIEKKDVIEILSDSGLMVLDVKENYASGPEWISFKYFASK